MNDHRIYTGNRFLNGVATGKFGRCICGALLEGQEEIDQHRQMEIDQDLAEMQTALPSGQERAGS